MGWNWSRDDRRFGLWDFNRFGGWLRLLLLLEQLLLEKLLLDLLLLDLLLLKLLLLKLLLELLLDLLGLWDWLGHLLNRDLLGLLLRLRLGNVIHHGLLLRLLLGHVLLLRGLLLDHLGSVGDHVDLIWHAVMHLHLFLEVLLDVHLVLLLLKRLTVYHHLLLLWLNLWLLLLWLGLLLLKVLLCLHHLRRRLRLLGLRVVLNGKNGLQLLF